jgi:hypothetical protein
MKTLILSLFVMAFCGPRAFALTFHDLQAGDVVLLSLNCYECRVIESETNSLFSHSGVVLVDELGQTRIGQSLGRLDHFSFSEFTKNKTPGTFVHVYRAKELKNISLEKRVLLQKSMLDVFNDKFKNAPFDSRYLWNNFTANGVEALYCSEFIAKFLDYFLVEKTIPFPISYKKHFDYWSKYFKGDVPEGELGNSPAGFSRDARFEFIGKI